MNEPWECYPNIWKSKTAFFTYLRGQLRRLWSRYPAKLEWKKKQGVLPPPSYTGRAKKLCQCYYCQEFFPISSTEVDHAQMAGTCNSWETANQFLHNLLNCSSEWRITCKPCHKIKNYAERMGIEFKEAVAIKSAIEFCRQDKQVVIDFLRAREYNDESISTVAKRKKLIELIFKEEFNK